MISLVMLNDSPFDSLKRFGQLVLLSFVIFGIFTLSLIVPGLFFLCQLSQILSLILPWVFDKLFVFQLVFSVINEGFKFIFSLSKISFLLLSFFISFKHFLCSFIEFFLFAFNVIRLFISHLLLIFFSYCFILFHSFILNLLFFLLLFVFLSFIWRFFTFSFIISWVTSFFRIFFFISFLIRSIFLLCWGILFFFLLGWSIFGFWFWNLFHVRLNLILFIIKLAVF